MAEEKYEPRALLEFGGASILMPADKAVEAFRMLCDGHPVQYDWEKKGYKHAKSQSSGGVTLRTFSLTEYASLALNSVDE
jgi:hypothetical protein